MERWVKATSTTYADASPVWLNMAKATMLLRQEERGLTVVHFGDETHAVRETPEQLMLVTG